MKWLADMILKPLLRRSGTGLAGFILFGGDWACVHLGACGLVSPEGATAVATWVVAAALVSFDLALGWIERKRIETRAVAGLIARNGG